VVLGEPLTVNPQELSMNTTIDFVFRLGIPNTDLSPSFVFNGSFSGQRAITPML
jgi:hypothetical protein